ncbi:hypothetical protein EDB82DRAFT_502224 [Fusarium venenatum]|uniref:uncharacterized protein n=1 Tax=Fusarium venenatum TaxID=56646 RepID=UPI001D74B93B|nr:hypothetical protein EDB82DRAFT_502224 [Fusarium venenatum]
MKMSYTGYELDIERQDNYYETESLPAPTAYKTAFLSGLTALPEFQERADIERQSNHHKTESLPAPTAYENAFLPGPTALPEFQERAGQGCFICLQSHRQGQYAVLVPCMRPTKPRQKRKRTVDLRTGESRNIYKENSPWDGACESDYEIYQRLLDTCYQHLGRWKKWLPYYGITEVLEVKFQFACVVESNGRYPISMKHVNLEDVTEQCKKTIARHPTSPSFDFVEPCANDYHSGQCTFFTEDLLQPCIRIQAEEAEKCLKRLPFLSHLKDCARNPKEANGLNTLKGMAQKSCIYDIRYVYDTLHL